MKQFVADRFNRPNDKDRLKALIQAINGLDTAINGLYDLGQSSYCKTIIDLNTTKDNLQAEIDQIIKLAVSKSS